MPRSLNHQDGMEEGGLNPRQGWRGIPKILVFSRDVFLDFGGRRTRIRRQVEKEARVASQIGGYC